MVKNVFSPIKNHLKKAGEQSVVVVSPNRRKNCFVWDVIGRCDARLLIEVIIIKNPDAETSGAQRVEKTYCVLCSALCYLWSRKIFLKNPTVKDIVIYHILRAFYGPKWSSETWGENFQLIICD